MAIVLVSSGPFTSMPLAQAGELLAYVAPSRKNSEIRLVPPEGGDGRTLFRVPADTHPVDGIGRLAWSPDGQQLAFTSGHDWRRSLWLRDIYVIDREGGPLRRPSQTPDPGSYDNYAKGSVKVRVVTIQAGDTMVFVEGAKAPVPVFMRQNTWQDVVVENVADFGEDVRQYVRVFARVQGVGGPCWSDSGVFADVRPGETVDAGELSSLHGYDDCARVLAVDWLNEDRLAMILREKNTFEPHNVWSVNSDAMPGQVSWEQLLDMGSRLGSNSLVDLAAGPVAADKAPDLALLHSTGRLTSLMVGPSDDLGLMQLLPLQGCGSIVCSILSVAWHPLGESLFVSRYPGADQEGILYKVDLSGAQQEVLRLPGEVIGRIAVSPDGKAIAFERAGRIEEDLRQRGFFGVEARCPCSIWVVNSDGGDLRELVADGRSPAWASGH